jgi:hypothetical protein
MMHDDQSTSPHLSYLCIRAGECATTRDLLVRAIESGVDRVLLEADALPSSFHDLSSGAAGDLIQGLANHGIRVAAVVPGSARHSHAFQAFARESNRGRAFRFFDSDAAADEWLRGTRTSE